MRPPEIEDRLLPGHWEADFIKGAGNQSSVGVLVERTSRLVLLAKMEDATAASALAGFSAKLNSIAAPLRQTFTYLKSAEFGTVLGLCGQSEHLEGVRVLPFGDEFREEIGFGAIHEKFGQALS